MSRTTGKSPLRKKPDHLEALWDDLLSRQPARIRAAYVSLDPSERDAILTHLKHMVSEPGWHTAQRASAKAALKAIESQRRQGT